MTPQRASCLIAVCSLLALTSIAASPAPRTGGPCKDMQHLLDRQIDDLKAQQKDELNLCNQSNGRNSGACLGLQDQQRQALRAMRDGRTGQMNDCYGRPFLVGTGHATQNPNNTYYNQTNDQYADNDNYPHKVHDPHPRHPHHPSPASEGKSASAGKPSSDRGSDGSNSKSPHSNSGNAGGSGSGSAVSHNHGGGGGGNSGGGSYSGSSHSSGGGGSSYSGGSSGGSSHSSGGGGGSYSGGSSSSNSSSSSSSAPSGGHPK
jgi:hypothetical protein